MFARTASDVQHGGSDVVELLAMPVTVRVQQCDRYPDAAEQSVGGLLELPETAILELCQARPEFELIARLGEGAFGRVYLARQHDLGGRLVALKLTAEGPAEARTLARLLHTNIVPIYSTHRMGYCHAACMPYLGSTTLADLIQEIRLDGLPASGQYLSATLQLRRETLPADSLASGERVTLPQPSTRAILDAFGRMSYVEAVTWLGQRLADGLAHAHERGIIHRDLKPANVLLTDEGQPMLLDFNLAQDGSSDVGGLGGTLPYLAPEILRRVLGERGEEAGPQSDVYSLGLILFELLTSRRPGPLHTGSADEYARQLALSRAAGPPPSPHALNPAVSPALESIVRRCLEPDLAKRYQSARELQEDLKRQCEHRPLLHAPERSLAEVARKWSRRHPRVASLSSALALASVLVACLAMAAWGYRGSVMRHEAEHALIRLNEEAAETHFLLAGRGCEDVEGTDRRAREALAPYAAVTDPRWREGPLISHLPAEKRGEAEAMVGSLLLILARDEAARARSLPPGPERDGHVQAAVRLNEHAGRNGAELLPRALLAQKADLHRLCKDEDAARECLARVEAGPAGEAKDACAAGRELVTQRRYSQALPLLLEATRLAPQNPVAWFLLGRCQEALGKERDAVASYTAVLALRPKTAAAHFQRGLAYSRLEDFAQARDDFQRALDLGYPQADAHLNKGLALHRLGRHADALAEIDAAFEAKAPYTRLFFIRARLRDQTGDRKGAALDRDEGLKRTPTDDTSWVVRGLGKLGPDPKGALLDFQKASELNPRSLAALVNAAHVLGDRQDKPQEALALLDRAVGHHPEHARTRATRALLLARLGRRDEAVAEAARLGDDPALCVTLSALYAQTSRVAPQDRAEAVRLLKRALRGGHGHDRVGGADYAPLRGLAEFERLAEAARTLN